MELNEIADNNKIFCMENALELLWKSFHIHLISQSNNLRFGSFMNRNRFRIDTNLSTSLIAADLPIGTFRVIVTIEFRIEFANSKARVSRASVISSFITIILFFWLRFGREIFANFATPVRAAELSVFAFVISNAIHSRSEDASSKSSFGFRTLSVLINWSSGRGFWWFDIFADLSTSVVTAKLAIFAFWIFHAINRWVVNASTECGWDYRATSPFIVYDNRRDVWLRLSVRRLRVFANFVASIGTTDLSAFASVVIYTIDIWVEDTRSEAWASGFWASVFWNIFGLCE